MDIIVGTAGHIDHGKTAFVKALTGVDADRLPEEKKRGITIDLGFAELDLGELRVGFVDVPGHEKFVKNMLAGAHGIDVVALVVAADEGVMPQTREHFDICRLLATKAGLVVITKIDLVDDELLELVKLDVEELVAGSFLEDAPVLPVSAKTSEGIESFKQTLSEIAKEIPARKNETVTLLPVDRGFSVRGFGAVVTGTLISGEINVSDEMELLPPGKKVRVRGLQTHGKATDNAHAGQRTAVNLGGVEQAEIQRGMVLTHQGKLRPTQIIDAQIEVLPSSPRSLKSRARVRVHLGTIEALARVQVLEESGEIKAGESGFVQLRLETQTVALPNERFIVRSYSPQRTIAGGKIIDGLAAKHRRRDFETARKRLQEWLEAEEKNDKSTQLKLFLETSAEHGLTQADLQARTGWRKEILRQILQEVLQNKSVIEAEGVFLSRSAFEKLADKTLLEVQKHHQNEPLSRGMMRETLREKVFSRLPTQIFRSVLAELERRQQLISEKDIIKAAAYHRNLSPEDKNILERLQNIYLKTGLEVPTLDSVLSDLTVGTKISKEHVRKIFQLLLDSGELVKITPEFYFQRENLTNIIEKIRHFAITKTTDRLIDVSVFKDLAGVSRKYAIPLLEYFDRQKITQRVGDKRHVL